MYKIFRRIGQFEHFPHLLRLALALSIAAFIHFTHAPWIKFLLWWVIGEIILEIVMFLVTFGSTLVTMLKDYKNHPDVFENLDRIAERTDKIQNGALTLSLPWSPENVWVFQKYFNDRREEFQRSVLNYQKGTIREPLARLGAISTHIPNNLESTAFCTALDMNLDVFSGQRGRDLFKRYQETARQLGEGKFQRVYILPPPVNAAKKRAKTFNLETPDPFVAWQHYSLMREDAENGVDVYWIPEIEAINLFENNRHLLKSMDFGIWDDIFLIAIESHGPNAEDSEMLITKAPEYLEEARRIRDSIMSSESLLPWSEYKKLFRQPFNAWSGANSELLRLPPSNGPSQEDCNSIIRRILNEPLKSTDSIVIFGATGLLLDTLYNAVQSDQLPIKTIICVDIRGIEPSVRAKYQPTVQFVTHNWFDWTPNRGQTVRFIVGDDILANLAAWQLPLFFRRMSKILSQNGKLLFRTSAKFSETESHTTVVNVLDMIKVLEKDFIKVRNSSNVDTLIESAIYELMWPVMHNHEFYDSYTCSFPFHEWNERMQANVVLSPELRELVRQQPYDANGKSLKVRITSPKYYIIKEAAGSDFVIEDEPASSVWSEGPLEELDKFGEIADKFRRYYMILEFRRKEDC